MNQGNVSLQNSFSENTKNLMKQTGENFSGQLPQISNYFDTQKKIAEINVENANKGIEKQTETDEQNYFDQFTNFNTVANNELDAFYHKGEDEIESGQLVDLNQKVQNYNSLIEETRTDISDQIQTITAKRDDLLGLENNLYSQFFSQDITATVDNFEEQNEFETFDNARTALAAKLQTSLGRTDNIGNTSYLVQLNSLINSISLMPSDYKLDKLVENGTIDNDTKIITKRS